MKRITSIEAFKAQLDNSDGLNDCLVYSLDLSKYEKQLNGVSLKDALFFRCILTARSLSDLANGGALTLPDMPNIPYDPYRFTLYSREDLYAGFDSSVPDSYKNTLDSKIYEHWLTQGGSAPRSAKEALSQRLHDHGITELLFEFLATRKSSSAGVIAIMGGHDMNRSDPGYEKVAKISRDLNKLNYTMVSGGGPGAMEATHLGCLFRDKSDSELLSAISVLSNKADSYKDPLWLSSAFELIGSLSLNEKTDSLGIPTWLYGHEPPTPFASHIAKYFANSLREDGLVTVGTSGIIYAPGSAGTIQEIFQDAAQNHYMINNLASAMVFLDVSYWSTTKPVYPLLKQLSAPKPYGALVGAFDNASEIVDYIQQHPPISQ